jgi:tetraacyldisaccharide 4'-kinase
MVLPRFIKQGASALFELGVRTRSIGYDSGLFSTHKVDGVTVISVGNLRMGGAGKTPMVIHLTRRLQSLGKRVAVISRGYKGTLETSFGMVSSGEGPLLPEEASGDEAYHLAEQLPGASVYAGWDRIRSVTEARDQGAEVAILDDGFSHRRLSRDLDILLASPSDLDESAAFFPLGDLRECPNAAARAHLVGGFEEDWQGRQTDFTFRHVPTCLVDVGGSCAALSDFHSVKAYLLCGIAKPQRFINSARQSRFEECGRSVFRDHHRFSKRDLVHVFSSAATKKADLVLTTEKDLVRIPKTNYPLPLFAIRIETEIVSGDARIHNALRKLFR